MIKDNFIKGFLNCIPLIFAFILGKMDEITKNKWFNMPIFFTGFMIVSLIQFIIIENRIEGNKRVQYK